MLTLNVELVGLAGVGKTHLKKQLMVLLGDRCFDLVSYRPSWRDATSLPLAIWKAMPLSWYVMRASTRPLAVRVRLFKRFMADAWRQEAVARLRRRPEFVLLEEGWFHKLRRLRQVVDPSTTYRDLPEAVRRRLLNPDLVVFVTADPVVTCKRKLQRSGRPITPEEIALQYARSGARGQWEEDALTRLDLEQASAAAGVPHIEIEYGEDFDVAATLIPLLERARDRRSAMTADRVTVGES